jgi:hypothetical protein
MKAEPVAFLGYVVHRFRALMHLLEEHLEDNDGELLPHVLMGDMTRWLVEHADVEIHKLTVRAILATFEENFTPRSADKVSELIAASFLENLPELGEPGGQIRTEVGPKMRGQLVRIGQPP